jgi:hypothetical protein
VSDEGVDVTEDREFWIREAFHRAAQEQGLSTLQSADGRYKQLLTRIAWRAFQAAIRVGERAGMRRAALVVETRSRGSGDLMGRLANEIREKALDV